jgi:hypothetical protein
MGAVGIVAAMTYLAFSVRRHSAGDETSDSLFAVDETNIARSAVRPSLRTSAQAGDERVPTRKELGDDAPPSVVAARALVDGVAPGASAEDEYVAIRQMLAGSGPASSEGWSTRAQDVLSRVSVQSLPDRASVTPVECFAAACLIEFHYEDEGAANRGSAELTEAIASVGWRDALMLTGVRHEQGGVIAQALILIRPTM